MTEIKTAQAWGHRSSPSALLHHAGRESAMFNVPYVIIRGLTEAEVHEAAALLEKSREVCEWERDCFGRLCDCEGESHSTSKHSNGALVKFCPSCGRKVVVK